MEWHPFIALPLGAPCLPLFVPVGIHRDSCVQSSGSAPWPARIYFLDELGRGLLPDASRLDDRLLNTRNQRTIALRPLLRGQHGGTIPTKHSP